MSGSDSEIQSIIQEFLKSPNKVSSKATTKTSENTHFLSYIKLPSFTETHTQPSKVDTEKCKSKHMKKFGFSGMLESVHGIDLHQDNPWFNNHLIAKERYQKMTKQYNNTRHVHFYKNEVFESELPYCRHRDFDEITPDDHIHAPYCKNSPLFSKSTIELWFERMPKTHT